jgi:hypothetical protein
MPENLVPKKFLSLNLDDFSGILWRSLGGLFKLANFASRKPILMALRSKKFAVYGNCRSEISALNDTKGSQEFLDISSLLQYN